MAQNQIIFLPVFKDNNKPAGQEEILVEEVELNQYKLLVSPGFVEGLACGDVITLSTDSPYGYMLVRHSGNLCVWVFLDSEKDLDTTKLATLQNEVNTIGGWLDGGFESQLFIFTIPVSVGFSRIEKIFNNAKSYIHNSTWLFGNVYAREDSETPLNWWL